MTTTSDIFRATPAGRLSLAEFLRMSSTSVLVAGLGSGSNIAELLVRKGVGRLVLADPGVYEPTDIRQRGSLASTWGRSKAEVVRKRLLDIHPKARVKAVARAGADLDRVDWVVDALNVGALAAKIELHRAARKRGKTVLCPIPVVNGAILWIFKPGGPGFERFLGLDETPTPEAAALRILQRLVPSSPPMPDDLRHAVQRDGPRTLPADAVGVEQAAVLAVSAIENLVLGRRGRVIAVPRGLLVDVSEPCFGTRVLEPTP